MSATHHLTALGMLLIGLTIPLTSVPGFQTLLSFGSESECSCETEQENESTRPTTGQHRRRAHLRFVDLTWDKRHHSAEDWRLMARAIGFNGELGGHCASGHRNRSGALAPLRC